MKKIVLTPPGAMPIPAIEGGATETLLEILIEENEKHKKAELIIFSVPNSKAEKIASQYKHTKVIYINTPFFTKKSYGLIKKITNKILKLNLPCDTLYYYKIYKKLKQMQFDYLVSEGGDFSYYEKLTNIDKKNIFRHIHTHQVLDAKKDLCLGHIIGVSKFVADKWKINSCNEELKTHVVYNCTKEERFNKLALVKEKDDIRTQLDFCDDDFIVLYCGRILDVKGVKELLLAIEKINNKKIKLLLIGSPNFAKKDTSNYLKEVQEIVNKNSDKVKFTGYIPNKDLYKYYQTADIQIVPSLWEEAAGLVAIEGMASGLPLIVTRSGGMVEYVDEKCATIIEKDENVVDNIKVSIEHLYNNPEQRQKMSEHGKERAKLFSKKRFYDEFIKSVLGE